MKVLSKDVVMSDIEKFLATCTSPHMLRSYAEHKSWDPVLFREFMDKLKNYGYASSNQIDANNVSTNKIKSTVPTDELCGKKPGPQTVGNRNKTQFSLSDEDLAKYATFIEYYSNLSPAFDYANDATTAQRNSPEMFDIYWEYCPKNIPEDRYNETRYRNFPYLIEMSQGKNRSAEMRYVDVPERYHKEWYYNGDKTSTREINPEVVDGHQIGKPHTTNIGTRQKYKFWHLIPTSQETPFYDPLPHMMYTNQSAHNSLPTRNMQWMAALQGNLAGDGFINLNPRHIYKHR